MIDRMKSEDTPGVAAAESGEVTLDGPDGVAITFSPAAARETGQRLIRAADMADKQRRDAAMALGGDVGDGDDDEGDE